MVRWVHSVEAAVIKFEAFRHWVTAIAACCSVCSTGFPERAVACHQVTCKGVGTSVRKSQLKKERVNETEAAIARQRASRATADVLVTWEETLGKIALPGKAAPRNGVIVSSASGSSRSSRVQYGALGVRCYLGSPAGTRS